VLLESNADINAQDRNGPPLRLAVMYGQLDMVRFLLERGADPHWRGGDGTGLLDLAIRPPGRVNQGDLQIVKLLMDHHVDINYGQGRESGTPLHQAVNADRRDLVEFLLGNGADIEARDRYGRRPLHRAVSNKNLKMTALLLARGAQVNSRDEQGRTPMYDTWGGSGIEQRIKELLRRHGGTGAFGESPGIVEGKEIPPGNQ
jgi:ankyrin repeat protein